MAKRSAENEKQSEPVPSACGGERERERSDSARRVCGCKHVFSGETALCWLCHCFLGERGGALLDGSATLGVTNHETTKSHGAMCSSFFNFDLGCPQAL